MALSEHEQRMLDAIEQSLFEDDPHFAAAVKPGGTRSPRPLLAGVLFAVGLAVLVGGAITATLWIPALGIAVAVIGFVLMVGGGAVLMYGLPTRGGVDPFTAPQKKATAGSPLSARMEERFRRRMDE